MTAEPSCKDEARVGQQGTLTYVWAERGSRPRAPKNLRYEWAKLVKVPPTKQVDYQRRATCSAPCAPNAALGAALVLSHANTHAMNLHLAEISRQVTPGAHALLICDGAGWHRTDGRLAVPENISLLHLPPYSPELNPVENIWNYLRDNKFSNSVFDTYDTIVDRCCAAWTWLMDAPDRIRSLATTPSTKTVKALGRWYNTREGCRLIASVRKLYIPDMQINH